MSIDFKALEAQEQNILEAQQKEQESRPVTGYIDSMLIIRFINDIPELSQRDKVILQLMYSYNTHLKIFADLSEKWFYKQTFGESKFERVSNFDNFCIDNILGHLPVIEDSFEPILSKLIEEYNAQCTYNSHKLSDADILEFYRLCKKSARDNDYLRFDLEAILNDRFLINVHPVVRELLLDETNITEIL